ncbi:oligopeptide:H+ symporter [Nonomuraea sp. NPDC003804]|uniref:peptide MFS transporter n=1 Tax=Nonomuraea sp. NPDC003804 TaxID=3154547 RepID=UPI0033A49800
MRTADKTFFGHPWGLATLFGTEMWERFSFYGMRAILAAFLMAPPVRNGLGLPEATAFAILGVYQGMVYLTALPGGWVADRVLGARRAVLLGGVIIMCGHISMALPVRGPFFVYLGLLLIVSGTGLLKPNVSGMVGYLYREDEDARRDSGFSLFYMGINIGALAGISLTPVLAGDSHWHLAFGAAAVGMAFGLTWYVLGKRSLHGAGERVPQPLTPAERRVAVRWVLAAIAALAVIAALLSAAGLFTEDGITWTVTAIIALVTIFYLSYIIHGGHGITPLERRRFGAYIWLFCAAVIFWMIFDLAPGPVTNFAMKSVDLEFFGFTIPAGWTQNLNSLFVIVFSPIFAALWLTRWGSRVSSPMKFTFALFMAGLSFVVLASAATVAAAGVKVSILWLVVMYLMQTIGELTLSPVGLSVSTKLAPHHFKGQILGVWFLAAALGDAIGGQTYRLTAFLTLPQYYLVLGGIALAAGLFLLMFVGRLKALMGDEDVAPGQALTH